MRLRYFHLLLILVCLASCEPVYAAENYVILPNDAGNTGKKTRTYDQSINATTVHTSVGLIGDPAGTNLATVKAASTPAAATDTAIVVSQSAANSTVRIGDGTNLMTLEQYTSDGEPGTDWAFPVESYMMYWNGTSADRVRGTIANGILSDISRIHGALPAGTNTIGSVKLLDTAGVHSPEVTAPSTAAATTDPGLVVSVSPNTPVKIWDGTTTAAVKAASTPAAAADPAQVVSFAGANSATKIGDGTNNAAIKAASTAAAATDPSLVVNISPNSPAHPVTATQAVGSAATRWYAQISDGSNSPAVKAASTAPAATDPSLTVAISPNGGNPCMSPTATINSIRGATSGTTAVQLIALSGSTKIYVCSLNVVGVSGTTPTFSLVYGTGTNCATGQTTFMPGFSTAAGTLYSFQYNVGATTAGQALCYLDTGTTPVQNYAITYVQQ